MGRWCLFEIVHIHKGPGSYVHVCPRPCFEHQSIAYSVLSRPQWPCNHRSVSFGVCRTCLNAPPGGLACIEWTSYLVHDYITKTFSQLTRLCCIFRNQKYVVTFHNYLQKSMQCLYREEHIWLYIDVSLRLTWCTHGDALLVESSFFHRVSRHDVWHGLRSCVSCVWVLPVLLWFEHTLQIPGNTSTDHRHTWKVRTVMKELLAQHIRTRCFNTNSQLSTASVGTLFNLTLNSKRSSNEWGGQKKTAKHSMWPSRDLIGTRDTPDLDGKCAASLLVQGTKKSTYSTLCIVEHLHAWQKSSDALLPLACACQKWRRDAWCVMCSWVSFGGKTDPCLTCWCWKAAGIVEARDSVSHSPQFSKRARSKSQRRSCKPSDLAAFLFLQISLMHMRQCGEMTERHVLATRVRLAGKTYSGWHSWGKAQEACVFLFLHCYM